MTSSAGLDPVAECATLYWPAGVKRRLPSGAKVKRRKNEVWVSLAYILAFFTPRLPARYGFGEFSIGLTAGKGIEGAGEAERRIDGDDPKDERRLCEIIGGFMGNAREAGVPGIDGAGDAGANEVESAVSCGRGLGSGGAGLLAEIRRAGRSIFMILLCWWRAGWPSLVLRL